MRPLVLLLALALCACSVTYVPMRPEVVSFDEANGDCAPKAYAVAPVVRQATHEACMRGKGWAVK